MMQCPSCSTPLVSGEARCLSCRALVNPPVQGASALAPRLVTPQSLDGVLGNGGPGASSTLGPPAPSDRNRERQDSVNPQRKPSADDAWRREVLERVRKRRQVRAHVLPLFVEGQSAESEASEPSQSVPTPVASSPAFTPAQTVASRPVESIDEPLEYVGKRSGPASEDPLPSVDRVLMERLTEDPSPDDPFDLQLRPVESENAGLTPRGGRADTPSQSLVERSRPTLVAGPSTPRSLVSDLPLVEPTRTEPVPSELPPRVAPSNVNSGTASMPDRAQAAFIDLGLWSFLTGTGFYFASRIARTTIAGLGPAWPGLILFGVVLAAAYILFFGGLSGATPGKIACGIQVKRFDGAPLGPLASLARGFLGILGVALLGLGVWPAFWDKDRRALHDRATRSHVTTV